MVPVKRGSKKRKVAGKYRGYGIVGSYFGWTFEFRKYNVFCCSVNLLSTLLVKQPSEAHVPLFRPLPFVRVSLQAALSTHINSAMNSQKGCVVQDWLILQKRSYSGFHSWSLAPLHCYLRQPFTQEKLGITTKRLKVYLPRMFEIRNEEFFKI